MLKFDFICLDVSRSDDGEYFFSKICFDFNGVVVGDFERKVLLGSLILSLADLLEKMTSSEIKEINKTDVLPTFNYLFEDVNQSMIPTYVESFDGDFGVLLKINCTDFLVVKKWNEISLVYIEIRKEHYADCIKNVLDYLKDLYDKNSYNPSFRT